MVKKILSIFIVLFNFVLFSPTFAWENFLEMMKEAEDTTSNEERLLGDCFETKKELIEAFVAINPPRRPSIVYEALKEDAMQLIEFYTDFYRKGIGWMAPWDQIAGVGLGTGNGRKMLACFVALADIRGLPTFKETLNKLLEGVEKPDDLESLTARFSVLKVSSS